MLEFDGVESPLVHLYEVILWKLMDIFVYGCLIILKLILGD